MNNITEWERIEQEVRALRDDRDYWQKRASQSEEELAALTLRMLEREGLLDARKKRAS